MTMDSTLLHKNCLTCGRHMIVRDRGPYTTVRCTKCKKQDEYLNNALYDDLPYVEAPRGLKTYTYKPSEGITSFMKQAAQYDDPYIEEDPDTLIAEYRKVFNLPPIYHSQTRRNNMKRIIAVKFTNNTAEDTAQRRSTYSYYTEDDSIEVGDFCVVVVSGVPCIVRVEQTEGLSAAQLAKAHKWLVGKVDMEEYKARQAKESMIQELQHQLDQELQAHNRLAIMAIASQTNPQIKSLLERLGAIDSDYKNALDMLCPQPKAVEVTPNATDEA